MGTIEEDKYNPWNVIQLEEFLFFCCPECDDRSPTKAIFINHALVEHPRVSNFRNFIFRQSKNF